MRPTLAVLTFFMMIAQGGENWAFAAAFGCAYRRQREQRTVLIGYSVIRLLYTLDSSLVTFSMRVRLGLRSLKYVYLFNVSNYVLYCDVAEPCCTIIYSAVVVHNKSFDSFNVFVDDPLKISF